ncbi:hypothetical protein MTO96_052023 [Rhipicephalus appendiculatus]
MRATCGGLLVPGAPRSRPVSSRHRRDVGVEDGLILHPEIGVCIVRETVPRTNAAAGRMMEPEEAASKLASGMIITIITVVVGVIVALIVCCVCCIRGCFRPERDIRAVVVQQGVHPDPSCSSSVR